MSTKTRTPSLAGLKRELARLKKNKKSTAAVRAEIEKLVKARKKVAGKGLSVTVVTAPKPAKSVKAKNEETTHIVLVLDHSGSMGHIAADMSTAVNQFLDSQRALPGKCLISYVNFSSQVTTAFVGKDITEVVGIGITADGLTALYDAIMKGIEVSKQVQAHKTVILLVTDGAENCSRKYKNPADVRDAVEKLPETTILSILGTEKDTLLSANRDLGIKHTAAYVATNTGTQAMSSLISASVTGYRSSSTFSLS